jgi:hypothetical protein
MRRHGACSKLRGARERIREAGHQCEGRKSFAKRDPELVLAAKRLHRRSPKGHRRSLREIARELKAMWTLGSSPEGLAQVGRPMQTPYSRFGPAGQRDVLRLRYGS